VGYRHKLIANQPRVQTASSGSRRVGGAASLFPGLFLPVLLELLAIALVSSCAPFAGAQRDGTADSALSPLSTEAASPVTSASATPAPTLAILTDTPVPLPTRIAASPTEKPITIYTYKIRNIYPHDRDAFTQGLVFQDGIFYEGTGLVGRSTLRQVDPETGAILKLYALPAQYFGEGIAILGNKLFQLTWRSRVGFVYDKDSFQLLRSFNYPSEGWGLTHDGRRLIMSDGTATLHFLNPETLEETGQIEVHDDNGPVTRLNELEYIKGQVYAHIWRTDRIATISPHTGQVTGWIDLAGLLSPEDYIQPVDVLNGIAYDAERDRIFVTGKLWPKVFEIELVPRDH
jgi:glutaminyl-peptide cyclotransferase